MVLNESCIRDIMKYIVNNLDWYIDEDSKIEYKTVNAKVISEHLDKYDEITIYQSIYILAEEHFIFGKDLLDMKNKYPGSLIIEGITYTGYQFYSSIQDDTIWNKTKETVSKVGNHTLKFIEETAQMVAVASAKQMVTVAMTQK